MKKYCQNTVASQKGAATVEVAVLLPLLLTLTFGSIEAANAIFLKQTMTIAAYEGAKVASKSGGTATAAQTRCAEFLASRGLTTYQFDTSPGNVTANTKRGVQISVTLTVARNAASIGPVWIYGNDSISKTVTMVRL